MKDRNLYAGLVVAGGRAERLGGPGVVDKPLLQLQEGGPTLLERAARELSRLASPVWVACRQGHLYSSFSCLEDLYHGCGPMGGIHAGLRAARHAGKKSLFVLACDMPFMTSDMLERLRAAQIRIVQQQHKAPLMTVFTERGSGFFQCLAALYNTEVLPFFEAALERRHYGLYSVVPEQDRLLVPFEKEEQSFFFNINTPEDLQFARNCVQHPCKIS